MLHTVPGARRPAGMPGARPFSRRQSREVGRSGGMPTAVQAVLDRLDAPLAADEAVVAAVLDLCIQLAPPAAGS